jgi:hypothetical protein
MIKVKEEDTRVKGPHLERRRSLWKRPLFSPTKPITHRL